MNKIAVIGAGPMGLAAAYELVKQGKQVDVYEFDDRIGGMSAHFDFHGMDIERYYHYVCGKDQPLFDLMDELKMQDKLHWVDTKMGYFFNGKLYKWGDPFSLLTFPHLGFIAKLRYGAHMFFSSKRKKEQWKDLDSIDAVKWLKQGGGNKSYKVLWERLFKLKFHHYTNNLSAAWIWARIRRMGQSRRSIFQESLGYIEDGSETLLNRLQQEIENKGGRILLNTGVTQVLSDKNNAITGVRVGNDEILYNQVISTIPLKYVPKLIPQLPADHIKQYSDVDNIGVVCLLFKLKKQVTQNFWLNISDEKMEIPGIIEMSNLRPLSEHVVYVPYYMPHSIEKFKWSDEQFIEEAKNYILELNPNLSESDFISHHVSRYAYAQPICQPDFLEALPPIRSSINGLFIADTSYYYPEDRSISESIDLGKSLAEMTN